MSLSEPGAQTADYVDIDTFLGHHDQVLADIAFTRRHYNNKDNKTLHAGHSYKQHYHNVTALLLRVQR